jgi:hypothetical protein
LFNPVSTSSASTTAASNPEIRERTGYEDFEEAKYTHTRKAFRIQANDWISYETKNEYNQEEDNHCKCNLGSYGTR